MAQAAGTIQTLPVTAAVRDARMGRRKVRRGDYIVLGPSDGLVASDRDRTAAVLAAVGKLKHGFELLTLYRGAGRRPRRGRGAARRARRGARGRRDRARRRRPAALRLPDRGRVSGALRRRSAPPTATPSGCSTSRSTASRSSASDGAATCARLGITTVRDLVFHFPRRYNDFSQSMTLGELRDEAARRPGQRDGRDRRPARRAGLPPAHPAHRRAPARRHGRRRGDLVRPALHRAPPGRRPDRGAVGQGRAARLAAALPEPGVRRRRRRVTQRRPHRARSIGSRRA